MAFLEVDDIKTYYGNIQALKGISLTVEEGECVTLIGSNGAGKSTTLRSISGLTPAAHGLDQARGRGDLACSRRRRSSGMGICPVARGPQVLPAHDGPREPRARRVPAPRLRGRSTRISTRIFELFPRLDERQAQKAGTMSGGEQQMLAIGRAMMGRPEGAAARRAVDGHLARAHRAHLRDDRARSTRRA